MALCERFGGGYSVETSAINVMEASMQDAEEEIQIRDTEGALLLDFVRGDRWMYRFR